jgi:5-methyltetrahydrofolate--homocysteine methyltransferase
MTGEETELSEEIIKLIKENVIQGRLTREDEGIEAGTAGEPGVVELVGQALDAGVEPMEIIDKGLTAAMDVVGVKYENEEYYIPDMLASAEAVGAGMELLGPHLEGSGVVRKGKVVFATVKGDMHDIGKNIVSILLRGAGYAVRDIGNNVETEDIIAAVREEKPEYLALSALLTSTMVNMADVIAALEAAGLRDSVKVIVGGAPLSREYAESIGADGYGADGFQAVTLIETLNNAPSATPTT